MPFEPFQVDFLFGMHTELTKPYRTIPRSMTLWPPLCPLCFFRLYCHKWQKCFTNKLCLVKLFGHLNLLLKFPNLPLILEDQIWWYCCQNCKWRSSSWNHRSITYIYISHKKLIVDIVYVKFEIMLHSLCLSSLFRMHEYQRRNKKLQFNRVLLLRINIS